MAKAGAVPSSFDSTGLIAVNPEAPGNTLTAHGRTIAVQAYEPGEGGNALSVSTTPAPNQTTPKLRGFTLEEELFRTKWGWQAFTQAQQIAAESPSETN